MTTHSFHYIPKKSHCVAYLEQVLQCRVYLLKAQLTLSKSQLHLFKKMRWELKLSIIRHGKTNKELAEHMGVSRQTVSKWVTGRKYPSIPQVQLIAEFLGCSVSEFLGFDEESRVKSINRDQVA